MACVACSMAFMYSKPVEDERNIIVVVVLCVYSTSVLLFLTITLDRLILDLHNNRENSIFPFVHIHKQLKKSISVIGFWKLEKHVFCIYLLSSRIKNIHQLLSNYANPLKSPILQLPTVKTSKHLDIGLDMINTGDKCLKLIFHINIS